MRKKGLINIWEADAKIINEGITAGYCGRGVVAGGIGGSLDLSPTTADPRRMIFVQ